MPGDTIEALPEPQAVAPSEKKGPIVLTTEDRLNLQNLQLRHMNAVQNLQLYQAQKAPLEQREQQASGAYQATLIQLSQKYGFDPHTHEMNPDTGEVRFRVGPAGPAPQG